jgi:aerobic-type carbon monoxide dehydrogenase small subunit (CoxS/CutS family)
MVILRIDGKSHHVDVPSDMRVLWVFRDVLSMTGTKFGCGMTLCGACTVQLDGQAIRSCVTPRCWLSASCRSSRASRSPSSGTTARQTI